MAAAISATTITPARLPISSADRCIGVSASRLMKPVSTSRARLVPALIEANSEPWMNGNAIAKSRELSAGKPGSIVAASRPPTLIAISVSGNRIGGITIAGWRSVCRIERRGISPPCSSKLIGSPRSFVFGLVQLAAGLGEEHVVKRRLVKLEIRDRQVAGIQSPDHRSQVVAVIEP